MNMTQWLDGIVDKTRRDALREVWLAAGGFPEAFDSLQGDPTPSTLALVRQLFVVAENRQAAAHYAKHGGSLDVRLKRKNPLPAEARRGRSCGNCAAPG